MEKEKLKELGIERIINQLDFSQELLEFQGRLANLEKDSRIKSIEPIRNSLTSYNIYLRKSIVNEDILLKMIEEYGFQDPSYIGDKSPLQLNFGGQNQEFMLRFYQ